MTPYLFLANLAYNINFDDVTKISLTALTHVLRVGKMELLF